MEDRLAGVLITDADNTLWDTNQVFADAQLRLLRSVEKMVGRDVSERDRLGFVRRYDQEIARQDHRGLKYPPILLVRKLSEVLGSTLDGTFDESEGRRIVERFIDDLGSRPSLRTGVHQAFDALRREGVDIWVVSEGRRDVVEKSLVDYGLRDAVSKVVSGRKNAELFRRLAKLLPAGARAVCVGDQLDRDIEPAKRAGFRTVYFPGGFRPQWTDDEMERFVDLEVDDYVDVVRLFEDREAA